ncbi:acyl-CoA dehydrogenase [Terrarubrum flagellatum]|uniref:acyl-CoA dehydrogenase family protein n=1 Tax=Terrirubrum flagellatum TaxID=2895980 RepID=UPI0031453FDA
MDFDLSDEQRLLKDSVDRMLDAAYGDFARRAAYQKESAGYSPGVWRQYAELGLLGLPFSEEDGGFGGGPVGTMIVMEAIGRTLALEPYWSSTILAGGLIALAGSQEQKADLIPAIAEGSLIAAFAFQERQARYDLFDVATTAKRVGDGYVLEGQKHVILFGDSANKFLVPARTAGDRRDRHGVSLFVVDAGAEGLTINGGATQDGLRAADITLEGVNVPATARLGVEGDALPAIERAVDVALAALCAEAVGAMEEAHKLTLDYLKTRQQFGAAIGSFQALQHRAADMLVALEQARSMAMYAAMMANDPDRAAARRAVAMAKAQINKSGRLIGQEAIQLHGGIGMTYEYKVGHLMKRLTMIETMFGDTDHHLKLIAG